MNRRIKIKLTLVIFNEKFSTTPVKTLPNAILVKEQESAPIRRIHPKL
jgi:hypothetical protein